MADKPKFDPNKPFTPVGDQSKPKFDPNKPAQAVDDFDPAPQIDRFSHPYEWLKAAQASPEFQARQKEELSKIAPPGSAQATVQKGLNLLPAAGGYAGGVAGTGLGLLTSPVTGPVGPVAGEYGGAALGSSAGEGLKYAGEKYLLGKDMSKEDLDARLKNAAVAGLIGQAGGNALNAAGKSFANSGIQDVAQSLAKPGAKQIAAAAANLKVKPTAGMMTDDYTVRNLEDSLGQSPTIPGSWVRGAQAPVRNAIKNSTENALSDASTQSDYEAGKTLKEGVSKNLQDRYEPIQQAYGEIEGHTKNVPLKKKSLDRISGNIRNLDEAKFEGSDGHKIANQFADWLDQAENVNDIKILKTKARNIAQDQNSSFEAKSVASSIMGKLEQAQTNSITRQAVSIAREGAIDRTEGGKFLNKGQKEVAGQEADAEGENLGKKLIGDIKNTNKQYRGLMEDAKTFGKGSGLTKGNKGMSATISDIESASPEDVSKALFDQNNVDFLKFMKEKMPDQLEAARKQKLAEILQKTAGDPNKLLKITEKMGPEAKQFLFGAEHTGNLESANTLLKAIPGKVGASDTPRGLQFKDILSPTQNAVDLGRYGLLKGKQALPKAGLMMQKAAPYAQGLINKGLIDDRQD